MTEWVFAWKENGWRNANGGAVENKADFQALGQLIEMLEEDGLHVKFWKVGRESNIHADALRRRRYFDVLYPYIECTIY